MRLPQDRILHIDTELKDGKVNVVAEWQGELVRCKDCKFYEKALSVQGFCQKHESIVYVNDFCSYGEREESKVEGRKENK